MSGEAQRSVYIPFRLDAETDEVLTRYAAGRRQNKSEAIRDLIDKGLKAEGVKPDDERLYNMVKAAVLEVEKPHVERLAAISAKAAQISGAEYFLLVYVLENLLRDDAGEEVSAVAARARQLGIEYLKLRDKDIDAFIRNGIVKMRDN